MAKWLRVKVELDRVTDHGLIVRLPFGFGISFWAPWWQLMFGLALKDTSFIEWNIGPFGGEMWREDGQG